MTDKQQLWFNASLWPAACRAQGWKTNDRALKLRVVGEILGRQIGTTKEVEPKQEFDRLKDRLQALAVGGSAKPVQPGRCSAKTLDMLETLFGRALRAHCRANSLDKLDAADIEALRDTWTTQAIGKSIDWTDLAPTHVDRLKPFLIWQADPDNPAAEAAFRTASLDGRTRRVIHNIVKRATELRQIEALLVPEQAAELLTPESVEGYIASVVADKHLHRDWRGMLLPLLEDQLLITIEERAREWERLFKRVFGGYDAYLGALQRQPERFQQIADLVAQLPRRMSLAEAREQRSRDRAEKRNAKRPANAPADAQAPAAPTTYTDRVPF